MKKAFLLLLASFTFVSSCYAAMEDGKWGLAQVFDVQRSPPFPMAGSSFTVSNMDRPYDSSSSQYTLGVNEYLAVEDIDPASDTCNYRLVIRDNNDNFIREVQAGGHIYGTSSEGFLHVSTNRFGTFLSNITGYNLGESLTYTPTTGLAICAEVEAYSANGTPSSAAGTLAQPPVISGVPVSVNNGLEYSFTPTVSDPDTSISGLVFTVTNKPDWMTFDTATGELFGIPTESGVYENIEITVSDGSSIARLTPFSITVSLEPDTDEPETTGQIKTAMSGGGFHWSLTLFLSLVFICRSKQRTISRLVKNSLVCGFVALLLVVPVYASDSGKIYLGSDIGYARVKPEVDILGYQRDKDSDWIYSINGGYSFNDFWSIEGNISKVKDFKVTGSSENIFLDYNIYSLNARYSFFELSNSFSPYLKVGASYFDINSSSPFVEQRNDVLLLLGVGTSLFESEKYRFVIDLTRYAKDLQVISLGFEYKFGTTPQYRMNKVVE